MEKSIVIYYSNNGSNRFLSKKIADALHCDIEEIRPYMNFPMLFWMGVNFGFRRIKADLSSYERIFLVGPIWMGKFIVPLKAFVKKHYKQINKMIFVSCCGSGFDKKDEKFGHGTVFKEVRELMNDKCSHCVAFPIDMLIPEELKEDGKAVMETRLNEESFKGEIKNRFDGFIENMKQA